MSLEIISSKCALMSVLLEIDEKCDVLESVLTHLQKKYDCEVVLPCKEQMKRKFVLSCDASFYFKVNTVFVYCEKLENACAIGSLMYESLKKSRKLEHNWETFRFHVVRLYKEFYLAKMLEGWCDIPKEVGFIVVQYM